MGNNCKAWKSQSDFPIKIIKYEDLLDKTYSIFIEIIEFINQVTKNNEKINKLKIKNAVNSTSFHKLKLNEKKFGFSESIKSRKDNKQIPFFFLGPENNWEKILDEEFKKKLNNVFEKNLKELSYI